MDVKNILPTYLATANPLLKTTRKNIGRKFALGNDSEVSSSETMPVVSSLSALLALQDINFANPSKLLQEKGFEILSLLDELKMNLLFQKVSSDDLYKLQETLQGLPIDEAEPALQEVIQAIKTRAAVEIAKHEKMLA